MANKSNQIRTTVHDITPKNQYCIHCGRPYSQVVFYTGKRVSATSTRVNYNTVQTMTTYRNVQRHVGGICRYCDAEKQKQGMKKLIIVGVIGTILFVLGFLIMGGVIALDPMKYGGLGVLLVCIGGLALICGVVAIMIVLMINPAANINYISLYTMFMDRLGKEGGKISGFDYLN